MTTFEIFCLVLAVPCLALLALAGWGVLASVFGQQPACMECQGWKDVAWYRVLCPKARPFRFRWGLEPACAVYRPPWWAPWRIDWWAWIKGEEKEHERRQAL